MDYGQTFILNLSVLISLAYIANVLYKMLFNVLPRRLLYILSVVLMIFAGWLCMYFGVELRENIIFDLRIVPLIIATVVYSEPLTIIIIGVGIGLARLGLGMSDAAIVGLINMSTLGILCAGMSVWLKRKHYSVVVEGLLVIVMVNFMNMVNLATYGVVPISEYLRHIAPITLPLGILLSTVFALILRDFQLDHRRNMELRYANQLMKKQTEELQRTKTILEYRAKQLMLASQYKSEFLANMSHELRTPLNSIINFAQIISESGDSQPKEEQSTYGEMIYQSGHDLLQLINDILDLSKVEAGHLEIVSEEVNLDEVPQLIQLHFGHAAAKKGLVFEILQEDNLPDIIQSDSKRLHQILRNLISNAIKFTHEGKVKFNIRRAIQEDNVKGDWIVFEVRDTGIGISPDKHITIFEAFQQADGSISRKYGGTGLGLSISRDLARLLGGFIRLHSEVDKGSKFSLFIPLSQ